MQRLDGSPKMGPISDVFPDIFSFNKKVPINEEWFFVLFYSLYHVALF